MPAENRVRCSNSAAGVRDARLESIFALKCPQFQPAGRHGQHEPVARRAARKLVLDTVADGQRCAQRRDSRRPSATQLARWNGCPNIQRVRAGAARGCRGQDHHDRVGAAVLARQGSDACVARRRVRQCAARGRGAPRAARGAPERCPTCPHSPRAEKASARARARRLRLGRAARRLVRRERQAVRARRPPSTEKEGSGEACSSDGSSGSSSC